MASPTYPRDSRPSAAFVDFVSRTKQTGIDGTGKKAHFIASSDLAAYWSRHNIETVAYGLGHPLRVPVDVIEARLLRVFSLLVYVDRALLLEEFAMRNISDGFFPLYKYPPQWPDDSPLHRELWELVKEHQWLFFPLVITQGSMCNRHLRKRHILPIVERDVIKDSASVTVSKIKVPWGCQRVVEDDKKPGPKRPDVTFVLKTYKSDSQKALYDAELDAWVALGDLWSDNIVMCWGGFVQGGTYNLVYEWANRGNLGSFMRRCDPPSSADELAQFWANLINILHGLHRFHQHKIVGTGTLGGIHQDLHLQNILLTDAGDDADADTPSTLLPTARFAFTPKLADFGNSHVRVAPTETDIMDYPGRARYGHQAVEPPEQSEVHAHAAGGNAADGVDPAAAPAPQFNGGPDAVTPRADIWALGGVFSQVLVWTVLGRKGVDEYYDMCLLEGGAHAGGAFHDGVDALRAVKTMHQRALSTRQSFDVLTPRIIEIIERHMLVRASERLTAKQLFGLFRQLVVAVGDQKPTPADAHARAPSQPTAPSTARTLADGEAPSGLLPTDPPGVIHDPCATLDEAEKWRLARIRGAPQDPYIDRALYRLRQNLDGRRFIFFLDDSISMSTRLGQVRQTLITLASITAYISPGAPAELVLASDPACTLRQFPKDVNGVAKILNKLPFDNMPELLETSLARVLDGVVVPHLSRPQPQGKSGGGGGGSGSSFFGRLLSRAGGSSASAAAPTAPRPVTLVVLTDGNWRDRGRGLELPLHRLVRFMRARDLDRGLASVQFLQFGESVDARRNLEYIVEDVGGEGAYGEIVDTRNVLDSVQNIFLGPARRRGETDPFEVRF